MDSVQHGGAGQVAARPFQAPTAGTSLVARGCWWQGGGQIVESQPSYLSKGPIHYKLRILPTNGLSELHNS